MPSSGVGRRVSCTAWRPMCRARQRPELFSVPPPGSFQEPRSHRSEPNSHSQIEPAHFESLLSNVNWIRPFPTISPERLMELPSSMGPASAAPVTRILPRELPGKLENQQFHACSMESAPDCSSTCQIPLIATLASAFVPVSSPVVPSSHRHLPFNSSTPPSAYPTVPSTYAGKHPLAVMSKLIAASMLVSFGSSSARPLAVHAELSKIAFGFSSVKHT
mmetsp:Transcript_12953/g.24248  ORF Transcript_12953/g.24248 Transcript_12953/m.24248 type:complete len:219 (-) Transcript_12953:1177-1833(-)